MNIAKKNSEYKKFQEIMRLSEISEKIMNRNNFSIIEIIAFYDIILMNYIIRPFLLNENYDKYSEIRDLISDKLSFMDKWKITCKISRIYNVERPKDLGFDKYIEIRNNVAHNLSSIQSFSLKTKEFRVSFGGKEMEWSGYQDELKKWARHSYLMAEFIRDVFKHISKDSPIMLPYCRLEQGGVLMAYNLLYPEPGDGYVSFFRGGYDADLINCLNEEQELMRELF